ncbi:phage baseplate plug family protein [Paenibacillus sp. strain BS8-2]
MEYIVIEKPLVPYRFDMAIGGETFTFEVQYNAEYDFFTVALEREGEVLALGEKIVYGQQIFGDILDGRFPKRAIIPFDESGKEQAATWNTLNESVYLFLYEVSENE